jgi:crotonobetainyl-CoA:carnitine CoA-transferase CaiB-like acyl-CoA transferase
VNIPFTTKTGTGLLAGIRVIDAGHVLAGPMTSSFLADFGAEVIHLEPPNPQRQGGDAMINRGKTFATLDLRHPASRPILHKLVAKSDVLTENFRPERMEGWGHDWPTLQAINPGLIYARLSGFGLTGPSRSKRAYGMISEAYAGWAWLNGYPEGPPMHSSFSWGDTLDSQYAAMAIVMALLHRDARGGGGQLIDQGLTEPLYRQIEQQIIVVDQTGHVPTRMGSQHEANPYMGVGKTGDGEWYSYSATTRRTIQALLAVVGLDGDPRFADWEASEANRNALHDHIDNWLLARPYSAVDAAFAAAGACGTRVMNSEKMVDDPHIAARDLLLPVPNLTDAPPIRMQGVVPKFSETPGVVTGAGGQPGQHNDYVYRELLGLGEDELAELKKAGAI